MVKFSEEKQNKRIEELRHSEEESLVEMLSSKYGIPYRDLSRTSINTDSLRLIPEATAREVEAAVIDQVGKKLTVAVHSPNKPQVADLVENLKERGYSSELVMVSTQSLNRAWDMYKDISFAVETKAGVIDMSGDEIQKLLKDMHNLEDVKNHIDEVTHMKKSYRISRILEVMLAGAIVVGSSDIHIEPEEAYVRIRYRLDGVLTDIVNVDTDTYHLILSRIKLISGLKLNVKRSAQDGRFSITIDNIDVEVRTSVIPDAYGESVVLRILNPKNIKATLPDLGIDPYLLEKLKREIEKPSGMLLTTGPTGSGKTTTLYAFLSSIHTPQIKIITIEDPVEYHLPGIVQTQVDGKKYTFESGLRAALRQDPDVIMIGEIRDKEVAETAIHSALTGHLVFSTLHTNSAAGSLARLVGLGVNPKVIGSAVNVVMAQRLIRKLCEHCKKEVPIEGEAKKAIEYVLSTIVRKEVVPAERKTMHQAVGCNECSNFGYKGRIGLYEAIFVTEDIAGFLAKDPSEYDLWHAAAPQGVLSMRQDGIIKVLRGITSLDEVERVVSIDADAELEQIELRRKARQEEEGSLKKGDVSDS